MNRKPYNGFKRPTDQGYNEPISSKVTIHIKSRTIIIKFYGTKQDQMNSPFIQKLGRVS